MVKCIFENGNIADPGLRHVTTGAIVINDKKQVLLIKRAKNIHNGGKFAIPGGYLDRDENTLEGTLRELKEETGFVGEVMNLFCINDNPNRPKEDRQNVDFIYILKIVSGMPIINTEVSDILWFGKDELPKEEDFAFDHRNILLKYFDYLEKQFPLPVSV